MTRAEKLVHTVIPQLSDLSGMLMVLLVISTFRGWFNLVVARSTRRVEYDTNKRDMYGEKHHFVEKKEYKTVFSITCGV